MQLGMPITTTSGGIRAVSKLILYPNKCKKPTLHTTPMPTTMIDKNMALMERKKSNKIKADSTTEAIRNNFISCWIIKATWVRINGNPLMCVLMPCIRSKPSVLETMAAMTASRFLDAIKSLFTRTPMR